MLITKVMMAIKPMKIYNISQLSKDFKFNLRGMIFIIWLKNNIKNNVIYYQPTAKIKNQYKINIQPVKLETPKI